MKRFIASYQDGKGRCWDIIVYAENRKEAMKDARKEQKDYGRLYSLRIDTTPVS